MTDKNKEALDFIWKHAKGILCECGKEDAPCLGCTAIKTIRAALENAPEVVTVEDIAVCIQDWRFNEDNKQPFFGDYLRTKFPNGLIVKGE